MKTGGESNWSFEIFLNALLNALSNRDDRRDIRDLGAISVNQGDGRGGDAARRFNRPRDLRFGREHRHLPSFSYRIDPRFALRLCGRF